MRKLSILRETIRRLDNDGTRAANAAAVREPSSAYIGGRCEFCEPPPKVLNLAAGAEPPTDVPVDRDPDVIILSVNVACGR